MFSSPSPWLHWYRKPSYRDPVTFLKVANADIEKRPGSRTASIGSQSHAAIPANLSLDCVLANKTSSPLSLYDFYMYLKYIEMSPENLEFYIWFKDYEARYHESSQSELLRQVTPLFVAPHSKKSRSYTYTGGLSEEDAAKEHVDLGKDSGDCDFQHYIEALASQESKRCGAIWPRHSQAYGKTLARTCSNGEELRNVVALFFMPESPKELNIPPSVRKQALDGIATSDTPSFLAPVASHVYYLLRNCSHRNFIRLGVNNGTFETLCMVTIVGMLFTALGCLTILLIAFTSPSIYHSSRWRGLAAAPFWIIGFSFLFAGWRGSCFLLLLFSRRQELPWERLEDNSSTKSNGSSLGSLVKFANKLMIFERKIRVKDQGLRNLQQRIVIQSIVASFIATAVVEAVVLVLPIWK